MFISSVLSCVETAKELCLSSFLIQPSPEALATRLRLSPCVTAGCAHEARVDTARGTKRSISSHSDTTFHSGACSRAVLMINRIHSDSCRS